MKAKKTTIYLTQAAVIAAIYAVLTIVLEPISFSGNQFRIAEALTILPVLTPAAIPGLTVGCIIANLSSPYGIVDIVCGSAATLMAALCTRATRNIRIKNLPVLSAVFPVIFNGIIVGAEITYLTANAFVVSEFLAIALSVAFGELVVCYILGLPLSFALQKTKIFEKG